MNLCPVSLLVEEFLTSFDKSMSFEFILPNILRISFRLEGSNGFFLHHTSIVSEFYALSFDAPYDILQSSRMSFDIMVNTSFEFDFLPPVFYHPLPAHSTVKIGVSPSFYLKNVFVHCFCFIIYQFPVNKAQKVNDASPWIDCITARFLSNARSHLKL